MGPLEPRPAAARPPLPARFPVTGERPERRPNPPPLPAGRCPAGELEAPELVTVVLGQDARLPCVYRGGPGEQVAQVAWARAGAGEGARELALLHAQYGLHVGPAYVGRVERPPPRGPLDGSVLLRNAVQADEGEFECRVSTFPAGSFQARLRLRVLGERGRAGGGPGRGGAGPGPAGEVGGPRGPGGSCGGRKRSLQPTPLRSPE